MAEPFESEGQTKKADERQAKKQRRRARNKANVPEPPFPPPSSDMRTQALQPRYESITEPLARKELKERLVRRYERDSSTIAHGLGHVAIPNPHYGDKGSVPQYAVVRLVNCLAEEQQAEIQRRAEELDKVTICHASPNQRVY
jgi:hypothetical protein